MFSSCPEDCSSEEAGGAAGLQIPPQLSQSLWRIHTWICVLLWTGSADAPNTWSNLLELLRGVLLLVHLSRADENLSGPLSMHDSVRPSKSNVILSHIRLIISPSLPSSPSTLVVVVMRRTGSLSVTQQIFICQHVLSPPMLHLTPPPLTPPCCLHRGHTSQTSNGLSYTCSLPSTPVVSHRELRVAQSEAGGSLTSRSLKNIPRRPSLFKVSCFHPRLTPVSPLSPSHLHSAPSAAAGQRSAVGVLLQNRDSEKKAAEGKGDPSTMRGVPIKQVCVKTGSFRCSNLKSLFIYLA